MHRICPSLCMNFTNITCKPDRFAGIFINTKTCNISKKHSAHSIRLYYM